MFNILEKYDKNEAPVVIYRIVDDESLINKDGKQQIFIMDKDDKINLNVNDFFTLISKLSGNVWLIVNGENTVLREKFESFKAPNLFLFCLIESKKVFILQDFFVKHSQKLFEKSIISPHPNFIDDLTTAIVIFSILKYF